MQLMRYTRSMQRKLAVFDIDGTLFRWQLYHELVFELKERGQFSDDEMLTLDEALLSWQARRVPWRDYEQRVIHTIEDNLKDIMPAALEAAAETVVSRSGHKIYNYTATLLRRLQKDGYYTLALSASQQEVAEQFAARYHFDDCLAAVYERLDDTYTGGKLRHIHGRKHEIIHEYLKDHPDLTLDDSIAVGDSDGDISMLEIVTHPIAFNPSQELLTTALERRWQIVVERKSIAYTLEHVDGHVVLAKTDHF